LDHIDEQYSLLILLITSAFAMVVKMLIGQIDALPVVDLHDKVWRYMMMINAVCAHYILI
jgi:hypothetical protein